MGQMRAQALIPRYWPNLHISFTAAILGRRPLNLSAAILKVCLPVGSGRRRQAAKRVKARSIARDLQIEIDEAMEKDPRAPN